MLAGLTLADIPNFQIHDHTTALVVVVGRGENRPEAI